MNRRVMSVQNRRLLAAAMIAAGFILLAAPQDVHPQEADGKLRIIAFGAHPYDCELKLGGTTDAVLHGARRLRISRFGDSRGSGRKKPGLAPRRLD